ncbi:DUF2771 family protein [Pseudonocardia sp.]|uniref:DUF2771 family protein n=1 Tax=Pseudonocardia sp. TaxID=60912 RepID=UPI002611CCE7|nr:DUF2771 family protein [Pseudonocardia sp.]
MLRRLALTALALVLVAGCGAGDPPEVTFAAGGAEVVATPTQYCEDDFVTCRNDPAAPVDLAVPAGTPLVVTVPDRIADTPWQVVFTYRTAAGEPVDERTGVFSPQERQSYTLELPDPQAELVTAQVQQFGPPPQLDDAGEIVFPIRASWVLTAAA